MKKSCIVIISIFFLLILTSCSKEKDNGQALAMLNVDLTVQPEKGEINKPILFKAKVTMGKERVNDADEVAFEIWRANDKTHEKIQIKHPKNGVYHLERSFKQEGTYYIISHVTARSMHNMPKREFIIGKPSEPENTKDNMDMKE